jgi:hypothetical protein
MNPILSGIKEAEYHALGIAVRELLELEMKTHQANQS